MKDLQEPEPQPEPPLVEPVVPDEEGGKKDDKNDAEKNDTSAGFTFSMDLVYDKDAKTNDKKHDKKDGERDDKKDNDDKKEPEPRATEDTAPQD